MNGNVPIENYPDHLNPFKSKGGLRSSFRKMFRSFTGKDKERPNRDIQRNRNTIQAPLTIPSPENRAHSLHLPEPEALPRSRFKERLEKTEQLKRISTKENTNVYNADNPFDEDLPPPLPQTTPPSLPLQVEDTPPVPAVRSKLRKKKKKRVAPLPPGITSNDGQYLDVPSRNGSKWSLTSTDTDASSICYSENEEATYREEETQQILEITRKIAEFTDDTNNNLTFSNEVTINVEDVDSKCQEKIVKEKDNTNDEIVKEKESENEENELKVNEENELKVNEEIIKEENVNDFKEDYEIKDDIKNDEETEEVPKIETLVTNGCVKHLEDDDKKIDCNQNSILRVKIIDSEEVVLRRPEVYDIDDNDRESISIKEKIQHFESYKSSSPTSKVRQTILTKEKLLGTE